MKRIILFLFLLLHIFAFSQELDVKHYDTLVYNSGMRRVVTVDYINYPTIYFFTTNSKNKEVSSNVAINKLKYYVDYDSTGVLVKPAEIVGTETTDSSGIILITDTIIVSENLLSINPFSPFMLGLNISYMHRFGYQKRVAMHVPFRLFTLYGKGLLVNTGIGINYMAYNSKHTSFYAGISTQIFAFDRYVALGFPITIGFVRNLTKRITINAYGGVGPYIGHPDLNLPLVGDVHVGIGFKLGEQFKITNTYKK
jgi:hypothetical protein